MSAKSSSGLLLPLIFQSHRAARNTVLARIGLTMRYGAWKDIRWLITGSSFDSGRLPELTLGLAVGFIASISYDPGSKVRVSGKAQPTLTLAPALEGVAVPLGRDTIHFSFTGYPWYPQLFLLPGVGLLASLGLLQNRHASTKLN